MKTLLIIPTYNEKKNIEPLLEKVAALSLVGVDILVVDDNSPDQTAALVETRQKKVSGLFLLKREEKQGLASACIAGFNWGLKRGYEVFIQMDADFSHDPKYLPLILERIKNYDLIIASRYIAGGATTGWGCLRRSLSRAGGFYARHLLGLKIKDLTGGFNAWRAAVLKNIDLEKIRSRGYGFQIELKYLAVKNGARCLETPIIFQKRQGGRSKMTAGIAREALVNVWRLRWSGLSAGAKKFLKFCLVGASGSIIDLGLLTLLVEVGGLNVLVANACSFTASATNNFVWNKTWTFRNRDRRYFSQFSKFFLVSVGGLFLSTVFLALFVSLSFWYVFAKLMTVVIVVVWNFFLNNFWTFGQRLAKRPSAPENA